MLSSCLRALLFFLVRFNNSNRFRDGFMVYSTVYNSPIGRLTMASDGENLIGLWIDGQTLRRRSLSESFPISESGYGKFCLKFHTEKPRLTARLQSESKPKRIKEFPRRRSAERWGIIRFRSSCLATE